MAFPLPFNSIDETTTIFSPSFVLICPNNAMNESDELAQVLTHGNAP